MSDTIERLCHEYVAWNIQQGLNLGSADEHWHDPALTHEERVWVREFSRRWDVAVDAERAQAEVEAKALRLSPEDEAVLFATGHLPEDF